MAEKKEKRPAGITAAIASIKKAYGADSISINEPLAGVEFVSSGSIGLDLALGGGFAKGRVIEILGPEASSKTTLCLHLVAEIQRNGGIAALLDVENALDTLYAEALGVNTNDLVVSQPEAAEHALDIAEILIRSGDIGVVVIDSVAALVPLAELEGQFSDQQMGLQARMMSKAMRKLVHITKQNNTILVFTNQFRSKIGPMGGKTTTGGNALKYAASQRIELEPNFRDRFVMRGEDTVATNITAKVIKNKVAPPHKRAKLTVVFGRGLCPYTEIINLCIDKKILTKSGSWIKRSGEVFSQGFDNAVEKLKEDKDLFEELRALIQEELPAKKKEEEDES